MFSLCREAAATAARKFSLPCSVEERPACLVERDDKRTGAHLRLVGLTVFQIKVQKPVRAAFFHKLFTLAHAKVADAIRAMNPSLRLIRLFDLTSPDCDLIKNDAAGWARRFQGVAFMRKSVLALAVIGAACSSVAFAAEVKKDKAHVPAVKATTMSDAQLDKVTAGNNGIGNAWAFGHMATPANEVNHGRDPR